MPSHRRGDGHQEGQHSASPMKAALNLVSRPETERHAEQQPPARLVLAAKAAQRVERDRPGELVEHHGLEQIGGAEEQRAGQDAEGGERLGQAAAAELAGDERREHQQQRAGERGHQPDREQGIAQGVARAPSARRAMAGGKSIRQSRRCRPIAR